MKIEICSIFIVASILVITINAALITNSINNGIQKSNTNGRDVFRRAENVKCNNKTLTKMDSLVAKMMTLGQKNRRFPENTIELRQYCNEAQKYSTYFLGYAKNCFNDFIKRVMRVMQYPIENEVKQICKSGRPSKNAIEVMSFAKCGNAARNGLQRCNENLIDALTAMKYLPKDKMMPMGCCLINVVRDCAKQEGRQQEVCTPQTIDSIERYALQTFGSLVRLGCSGYLDNYDRCDGILAEMPKLNLTNYVRPKSYFPAAMDLMDSLPDFDL